MKNFWPIAKWFFISWGIVCFVGGISLVGLAVFKNTASSKTASKRDVRFVLNWCRLGDDRIEEVVHSYVSARSITGDHLDAHAIRITHVTPSELTKDEYGWGWTRCDQVEGVLDDALKAAIGWLHYIPWFPTGEELRSDQMYVYPESIYCQGTRPTAFELIFVRPKDRMIFFISGQT